MKISNLLSADRILLDIEAHKPEGVIEALVNLLAEVNAIEDPDTVLKLVIDRELEVGTGIGYGVAIPHTEPGPFPEPLLAFGRTVNGINFHSPDGSKARLIFLLLTPDKTPALHVRLLARICRLMKCRDLREKLLEVRNSVAAARLISEIEADYPELNP